VGVEILPELTAPPREYSSYKSQPSNVRNSGSVRRCARLRTADEPLVLYLFNRCPKPLCATDERLEKSWRISARVWIVYHNPLLEPALQCPFSGKGGTSRTS